MERIIEEYKLTKKTKYKAKILRLSKILKRLSIREKISTLSLQTFIDESGIDIPLCILYELNNNSIYSHQVYVYVLYLQYPSETTLFVK